MFRKSVALVLVLLMMLAMLPAACAEVSVVDMYGRDVTLAAPAERIVALSAADCEILCAIGCGDKLVGRGEYCNYPESVLDVPVVNSGLETNIEQIIALNPQLVLTGDMAQTAEQVYALENAGIRVALSDSNSIEDVYTAIRMIGTLAGANENAEAVIADMQNTFETIRTKAVSDEKPDYFNVAEKTVYFEISPLQWGLWTGGQNTFMDELAQICGITNVFADVDSWAEVSEEQVLARNPDYIVTTTMYYGEGPTPAEEILSRASWQDVKAIANGMVYHADSDEITRPGPRLKNAAEELYSFFCGDEIK